MLDSTHYTRMSSEVFIIEADNTMPAEEADRKAIKEFSYKEHKEEMTKLFPKV